MREDIGLYRGKRDNGEWLIGCLVVIDDRAWIAHADPEMTTDEVLEIGLRETEVDPETVGQFTGLQDSNSVDICEGDVLNSENGTGLRSVVFKEGVFLTRLIKHMEFTLRSNNLRQLEVIGNIHDNPELWREDHPTAPTRFEKHEGEV